MIGAIAVAEPDILLGTKSGRSECTIEGNSDLPRFFLKKYFLVYVGNIVIFGLRNSAFK